MLLIEIAVFSKRILYHCPQVQHIDHGETWVFRHYDHSHVVQKKSKMGMVYSLVLPDLTILPAEAAALTQKTLYLP
jgi:hypothetical protein